MKYRSIKNLIPFSALLISVALTFSVYADVTVETDEFGVAYVLNEDGTKDYSHVPAQINESENEQSRVIMYDPNSYDLGLNGPTRDQSTLGLPEGMSAEYYAAIHDNVIEWTEIADIVKYYNPTYVKYFSQANTSITEMRSAYDAFRTQMQDAVKAADEGIETIKQTQKLLMAIDSPVVPLDGKLVSKEKALETLSEALDTAKKGRQQAASAIDTTKRSLYYASNSVDSALRPVRNQLISVVEALVISYKTLEVNRSLVVEQVALYEALAGMQANMQAQNMVTSTMAAGYVNQLNTARKTLAEIDAGAAQLKNNILMQCGYDPSENIVIADLPAPDVHFLDGRNYEADKKQAVDGNSAVVSAGKLRNYENSSYGMKLRDLGENEARGKAAAAFDSIHNELQRELILADAADTSMRKAELTARSAEVKYNTGMVSRAEYEGLRMQYMGYQASAKLTFLNLHQAIENYKWAMLGVMTVE